MVHEKLFGPLDIESGPACEVLDLEQSAEWTVDHVISESDKVLAKDVGLCRCKTKHRQ